MGASAVERLMHRLDAGGAELMAKTYTGDDLAKRLFLLVLAGVGAEIAVMVLIVM